MIKRLLTILSFTLAVSSVSAALLPDAKFRRLDTPNGLSNSQVNCILRDSKGYVWMGTAYGLNRYDGYRFKTFYANVRDTTTIRDNVIDRIYEAYDGRLWLRTGMNYCIYDPSTEQFNRNVSAELARFGIEGGIDQLYIDDHQNFWVKVYEKGLYYYNPHSKHLHFFRQGYGPQELRPEFTVSTFATLGSSVVFATNNGELVCLNGEKGHISWTNSWMRRHGGPEGQEYRVRIDPQGNLWISTVDYCFVYMQKQKRWYPTLTRLLQAYGFESVPDNLMIWDVQFDRHGLVWVATDHEGLFAIDMKSRQLHQFLHDKLDATTISENTVRNVYEDRDGQIWVGTYKNGANQYRAATAYAHSFELGDINAVSEDRYGNYWLGTNDNGIVVYNPATGEQLQHYTTANSPLSGNIIVGSTVASDGSIWFGSYNGGLIHCMPVGNKSAGEATIVNYRVTGEPDGLANNSVWSIAEDKWHRIWLGLLGGGVQMLDLKTGKFRTWDTSNSVLSGNYISSSCWTKKGWLMVGTGNYYSIINPVKGRVVNQPFPGSENLSGSSASTVAVMEDSRGLVWQGSVSGLCIYDPSTEKLQVLDMTNGLYGSTVCSITEDQLHVMWVVTDHGVSRIIPQLQQDGTWQFVIRSFNHRDGLQQGTYNQRSTCLTHDGRLLIGGQNGLDIILPAQVTTSMRIERPLLSGLLLFDQEVRVGEKVDGRIILDKALGETDELRLRYSENNFTIQLGSDAGYVSNDKRFVYKLEGFRDTWSKTGENNPNIAFMSLRYGDYTLRVRMLNDDGTMGHQEAKLRIHISAPFWRARWAILLYVVAVLLIAWWWRRRFLSKQRDHMRMEQLRRETEKDQWMHETLARIQREQQTADGVASPADDDTSSHASRLTSHDASVLTEGNLIDFLRRLCNSYVLPADKSLRLSFLPLVDKIVMTFDPKLLEETMRILIDNSIDFSPSDGRIKVMADLVGGQAEIRVADNGLGIPEEAKPHMFAPPLANENTISLHVVKENIERMGGQVRVNDNTPTGTVFFITLPVGVTGSEPVENAVIIE